MIAAARRGWSLAWALGAALAVFAGVPAAFAQTQVGVRAEAPESAYVGDSFEFRIVVEGSTEAAQPDLPDLSGATWTKMEPQTSQMSMIVNGRRSDRVTLLLRYAVTAQREGVVAFPPLRVTIAGRDYVTQPTRTAVRSPKRDAGSEMELSLSAASAYVGEPLRLRLRWTLGREVRPSRFTLPVSADDFDVYTVDPRPQGTQAGDPRFADLTVDGLRGERRTLTAQLLPAQPDEAGGERFIVQFDLVLIARRPSGAGAGLPIGPARADFDAVIGRRARTFNDSILDDLSIRERRFAESAAPQVPVRALPERGRPADFSGLVGKYRIESFASPREAAVGDPIEVGVRIYGPPPLSLAPPLDPTRQPGLVERFRLPRDPVLATVLGDNALYQFSARARSHTVTELPPLELSYFDTGEEAYKVARSAAVPLNIRPSAEVTVPGMAEENATADRPVTVSAPRTLAGLTLLPGPMRAGESGPRNDADITGRLGRAVWLWVFGGPLAVFAGCCGFALLGVWTSRTSAPAERRRALRAARTSLRRAARLTDPAGQARSCSAAIREYVARTHPGAPRQPTAEEAAALVERDDPGAAAEARALLRSCDAAVFSALRSGAGDGGALVERAVTLLDRLHRTVPSTGVAGPDDRGAVA